MVNFQVSMTKVFLMTKDREYLKAQGFDLANGSLENLYRRKL